MCVSGPPSFNGVKVQLLSCNMRTFTSAFDRNVTWADVCGMFVYMHLLSFVVVNSLCDLNLFCLWDFCASHSLSHHVRSQGCLLVLVAPGHPRTKVINQLYCCVVWPQSVWGGHSGEERDWAEDSAHLVSIHRCQQNDFGPDRELCTEHVQCLDSDSAVLRWAGGGQRLCRQLWDLGVWDRRDHEPGDYRVIVCVVFHSLIHLFIYKTHLSIWSNKQ